MHKPSAPRVCIDLTPNETLDRHGGIGRYGYYLLEQLLQLREVQTGQVEIVALPVSAGPVISGQEALERAVLQRAPIRFEQHRRNRRLLTGSALRRAHVSLFHAVQPVALPLLLRCKLVCTIHDLIPIVVPRPYPKKWKVGYRRRREKMDWTVRAKRADHLVAISEWTANDLVTVLEVPRTKITTVYHGLDERIFNTDASEDAALRQKYDLPERGFLCVSSDHYRKNHRVLFDAWSSVASSIPEGLVFVGHAIYGSTLSSIQDEVRRRGLSGRFRWLSSVEDRELPAIYRWARATVAPSLYEGFGMTLIEAMACGSPVIAARNGVYEEVGDGAVLTFDGTSAADLAECLVRLSSDEALRTRLVALGFERARRFTWRRTAEATLAVYLRALCPTEAAEHPALQSQRRE